MHIQIGDINIYPGWPNVDNLTWNRDIIFIDQWILQYYNTME